MSTAAFPPVSVTRRRFLEQTAATGAAVMGGSALASAAAAVEPGEGAQPATQADPAVPLTPSGKRPNILFVFSDEHRWCSMEHTEMPDCPTPNFINFAQQGMSFDNCIANAPVCVPFRGILQTGMFGQHNTAVGNGFFFNRDMIGVEHPTIGQLFKQGGYRTGYVGKWHLGDETCAQAGYDFFNHWKHGDDHWNTEWRRVHEDPEEWQTYTNYNAVGMTDHALEFIDQQKSGDDPWMLMVSWNPPHYRWDDAPEEFLELYPEGEISVRPNAPDKLKNDSEYRHYHAHISAIDHQFGRLMEELEQRGLTEDTIVIYTSDHGSGWHSNGFFSKPHPTDEVARVPFIIRFPGKTPAGGHSEVPIGVIDLVPTLLGMGGIAPHEKHQGMDVKHLFWGQDGPEPEGQMILNPLSPITFFHQYLGKEVPDTDRWAFRAWRTDRYTYCVRGPGEWMLYDNKEDPYQMKNLIDDPAHADLKKELRAKLDAKVREYLRGAEMLPPEILDLPLEELITKEEEFWTLQRSEPKVRKNRQKALEPLLAKAETPEQKDKLRRLADEVYDLEFRKQFGWFNIKLYSFWVLRDPDDWKAMHQKMQAYEAETKQKLHEKARDILG